MHAWFSPSCHAAVSSPTSTLINPIVPPPKVMQNRSSLSRCFMTYCSTLYLMQKNRHSSAREALWSVTKDKHIWKTSSERVPQFPIILKGRTIFSFSLKVKRLHLNSAAVCLGISLCTSCFDVQKQTLPRSEFQSSVWFKQLFTTSVIYLILFLLHFIGAKFIQTHYPLKALNHIPSTLIIRLRISTASMEYWKVKTRYGHFYHF